MKTCSGFVVPIFPKVRPLLQRLKADAVNAEPTSPVFKVRDPKRAMESSCRRLGLQVFSPRALRRYFIISALAKGVPVKTIADWQGHKDGGVLVLRTYTKVINRKTNQAAAQLLA